jgi:hypothetical protein
MVVGANRSGEAAELIQAEADLRQALMAQHSKLFFPVKDYGRVNVTINMYFHKVLKVSSSSSSSGPHALSTCWDHKDLCIITCTKA